MPPVAGDPLELVGGAVQVTGEAFFQLRLQLFDFLLQTLDAARQLFRLAVEARGHVLLLHGSAGGPGLS